MATRRQDIIEFLSGFCVSIIAASTPLLLVSVGELLVERAGVLNLGLEGMMLIGAVFGFIVGFETGSAALGVLAGMAGGMGMSLIFSFLSFTLMSNQMATGLALTIFGRGVSALLGADYVGKIGPELQKLSFSDWSGLLLVGPIFFNHDALVYFSFLILGLTAWFLYCTHGGLVVRAIGDSHDSAHAIGHPVVRIRYFVTLYGGAMAGLSGAYISLSYSPMWGENITAGRGWIALALVVFSCWRVSWLLLGSYLFGTVMYLSLYLQGLGIALPSPLISAFPYIIPLVVLPLMLRGGRKSLYQPSCLGKQFYADS